MDIIKGDFRSLEDHVDKHSSFGLKNTIGKMGGIGANLGCGYCWEIPLLVGTGIKKIYCVDYSKAMLELASKVLKHYKIPKDFAVLMEGNFNHLKFKNNSLDFILMCQAFHHSEKPEQLLKEIYRVLNPEGKLIILGEGVYEINFERKMKDFIKSILKNIGFKFLDLKASGEHIYTFEKYTNMFDKSGFGLEENYIIRDSWKRTVHVFVLRKMLRRRLKNENY